MTEGVAERIQLIVSRRFDPMDALLTVAIFGIDTIENKYVVMDTEIQRGAKAMDQCH